MILQRYIFRELVFTFAVAFAILVTVCAVGLIFNMFRTYEGVTLSFIFDALPMAFSFMAPWALLVASTLTATMVYGRLAAENEIDAMRTSGIHIGRIFAPAFLFAVFVFIFAFLVHHELGPRAKYKKRDIVGDTVIEVLRHPPPGQTNVKISNAFRLSYLEAAEGILKQPTLASFDSEGNLKRLFYGSRGTIDVLSDRQVKITIQDSTLIEFEMIDGDPREKGGGWTGKTWTVTLELEDPYARPKGPEDYA
ncbi:MAG TPA: LptF/LptG family permease, partial [Planctomycetota bacterium]